MKKLLSIILVLSSLSSFAFEADASKEEVVKAIKYSLRQNNLDCVVDGNDRESFTAYSGIGWNILIKNFDMIINPGIQPVITFSQIYQVNDAAIKEVVSITTNPSYDQVVSIEMTAEHIKMEDVQIGTIIDPKFEQREVITLVKRVECL